MAERQPGPEVHAWHQPGAGNWPGSFELPPTGVRVHPCRSLHNPDISASNARFGLPRHAHAAARGLHFRASVRYARFARRNLVHPGNLNQHAELSHHQALVIVSLAGSTRLLFQRDGKPKAGTLAHFAAEADFTVHAGRHGCVAMASPKPVPPYLRVVEPSAWLKA